MQNPVILSKPSWGNAPEWATALAMAEDGSWWWFEKTPTLLEVFDTGSWHIDHYDCKMAFAGNPCHHWKDSLESRPEQIKP